MSALLDLHVVYSNSAETVKSMRTFSGGRFRLRDGYTLPSGPNGEYIAGDFRATQSLWLEILHSIFYNLHNFLADGLAKFNKHCSDQRLFEGARRLNIAIYECLTYTEWIPAMLGEFSFIIN